MLEWDKDMINQRVRNLLEFVELPDYGDRDIYTLSGGEQQRVALARSLAPNPKLLMLDEPFSSLDRTLREGLIFELSHLLRELNQTAVYVTHDQEEAFTMADRVVLMHLGRIIQIGTPEEIYTKPGSVFAARFLGYKNILSGTLQGGKIQTPIGDFDMSEYFVHQIPPGVTGSKLKILLRPDAVNSSKGDTHQISGKVKSWTFRGSLSYLVIEVNGIDLEFEFQTRIHRVGIGEQITLHFNPQDALQIL
jgi:ABC-type Fe3+/spermidine/putrescine transport system ATPase subunit